MRYFKLIYIISFVVSLSVANFSYADSCYILKDKSPTQVIPENTKLKIFDIVIDMKRSHKSVTSFVFKTNFGTYLTDASGCYFESHSKSIECGFHEDGGGASIKKTKATSDILVKFTKAFYLFAKTLKPNAIEDDYEKFLNQHGKVLIFKKAPVNACKNL